MTESAENSERPSAAAPAAADALPWLSSSNCTGDSKTGLTSAQKKTADLLRKSIERLAGKWGIERIGFLTLTFKDHVECFREAQKRWHSLRTHVLKPRYREIIRVVERQKSGRIHYHVLVVLPFDIRTGCIFEQFKIRDYRSAPAALRAEWAFWRETAPRYRFGRTELMPIKSSAEAISKYVGKYIGKHLGSRRPEDKGLRLVEYTRGARIGSTRFSWNNPRAWLWRHKVNRFAEHHGCATMLEIRVLFGRRWAYHWADRIRALRCTFCPTLEHWKADEGARGVLPSTFSASDFPATCESAWTVKEELRFHSPGAGFRERIRFETEEALRNLSTIPAVETPDLSAGQIRILNKIAQNVRDAKISGNA